ncbi:MAG: tetratricopeptide repeat protein [bacterium]
MFNDVLWTLDNEMDDRRFERLCTDLLAREGYKDIVPIGGVRDRGRDAEVRLWKGIKATGGVTFFQYSLEKRWEVKVNRELKKVKENGHIIHFYVFVTSQKVTGEKRDKLAEITATTYEWQLLIYDREWLRHRLEEVHPDLAAKYLGITNVMGQKYPASKLKTTISQGKKNEKAWQLYLQKEYEAAVVEFNGLLKKNDQDAITWHALAECQYALFRYNDALISINHSISLKEDNEHSLALKACILTEYGIQKREKAHLLLAKDIFKKIAEKSNHWSAHYNYANTLHALGDYEGAKQELLIALDCNSQQPEIWTNLGTTYSHLQDHKKEIDCYNKALAINKNLFQALVSKGITLLRVFGKAEESIQLLRHAIESDEIAAVNWIHIWYWLGRAYYESNDLQKALREVNAGLAIAPHHDGLLRLKSLILSQLWRKDSHFINEALSFFEFRVALSDMDYDSFAELVRLYNAKGQDEVVWSLLEKYINRYKKGFLKYIKFMGHSLEEYLIGLRYLSAYERFRLICSIQEYIKLLNLHTISPDDDFKDALFIVCSIPFGLACNTLAKIPQNQRNRVTIKEVQSIIFNLLKSSLPKVSIKLLQSVRVDVIEQLSEKLSQILFIWSDIALLESSRQIGYIGGIFGISAKELDDSIVGTDEDLGNWYKDVLIETLSEINKQLKIFKE